MHTGKGVFWVIGIDKADAKVRVNVCDNNFEYFIVFPTGIAPVDDITNEFFVGFGHGFLLLIGYLFKNSNRQHKPTNVYFTEWFW